MTTIVVDASLREQLLAAGESVEFRDEAGNLIRQFVAVANGDSATGDDIDVTDEELDRREREERRFTGDQVLDRLRELRR
ncbi:MAG TPA: hypothetical protein VGF55_17535 [Gemmataceae bacterium]|jgi:hypothetical protein